MNTLKIRHFGPIKDCELEIRKYNMLIGPPGAGKSTISKILSIIHSFDYYTFGGNGISNSQSMLGFLELLRDYRISRFYDDRNSYLFFEDDCFSFELSASVINVVHKKSLDATVQRLGTYYIPAERIALPMINESLFELTASRSALPKYFLDFGKDFTVARQRQVIFNVPQLLVEFQHDAGRNWVTFANNLQLGLEEMSSAIQANLPLLVILQYPDKGAGLFVIEELELHGFPLLQKQLLYYIVERMRHPKLRETYLILPTHSPYILSAANNLLFASKVGSQNESNRSEVHGIIPEKSWMEPEEFSAYYIDGGKAASIIDRQTGLIDANVLDTVSEDLAGEFDALMELYKTAKA